MTYIQAIIIAIVEGLTEFLPISSTGHMVLTASTMGIEKEAFTKLFIETIQFGAIISVVVLYWRKFLDFKKWKFYLKLFIAFIPAAIVGILLKKHIDKMLETPIFIAAVTIIGGILLLFVDNWFKKPEIENVDDVTPKKSFIIGVFQVLAIIFPGLSRSAATIVGGMHQKLSRKVAAEFSFFLAVPTLAGAFAKSIWDSYKETPELLTKSNIQLLAVGNIVAFIIAIIAIKTFIGIIQKYGFKAFGYYRIILGSVLLILLALGFNLNLGID
jgi:undecaprenyl-diphosphatase